MNILAVSRMLGWFSLGLGGAELAMPNTLSNWLGMRRGTNLIRGFGAREVAAGITVLAKPDDALGPILRVAGDALDLAALAAALRPSNARRGNVGIAFLLVAGVTAVDILCAATLVSNERHRQQVARSTRVVPARPSLPNQEITA